jgi:AAA family ATP:ADP antiporter
MARDDQRGAWVATVSAVIVIASFVASKAARDAILLARFDVTSLPLFLAISAVTSLPVILVAGRLMVRWGPARLIPVVNVVSAMLAVGEWLLIADAPRAIAVVVFFHLATLGAVLVSGFWSIVNERFDVQSAKRHIARIGIGATLGGIFGGVIAERSAVYLAPDAILLVLAGLQLACAVTLGLFGRAERRAPIAAVPDEPWLALRAATRSPLLRVLGGLVILGAVAAAVMDYIFKADLVRVASHEGVLRSLAIFYTVTSVITAIVQVAVCGPLISRLGVARSVATLPATITAFGIAALALPIPLVAAIARGAEAVTRNSVYRAGYELIYAPLVEDHKRPAKLMLDVGADRIGDVIGAQVIGLLVWALAEPRTGLLIATVCVGAAAVVLALRLPRSYTMALEESLLARASDPAAAADAPPGEPQPWITLNGVPGLGQSGEFPALSLRVRKQAPPVRLPPLASAPAPRRSRRAATDRTRHRMLDAIADLRSGDAARIQHTLAAGLPPELAPYAVDLLGRDDVARAARTALAAIAPRCTGMLVDALLDPHRDVAVRRRLPAVLLSGDPAHASWGLWRALGDPSFDVRYRSGAVLARLAAEGHVRGISTDDVFDAVRRELVADREEFARHQVLDELAAALDDRAEADTPIHRGHAGLEHVFTVLGLVLPAEPLRIALHAVQTDDPELRGTALEYLESILPPDVRAQLWPLLEGDLAEQLSAARTAAAPTVALPPAAQLIAPAPLPATPRARRSHDEILESLRLSYPRVLDRLRQRPRPA